MQQRSLGDTGITVPALGFGAMHIGGADITDAEAGHLLNAGLDQGVTLIDTARSYGASEERIGKALSSRRDEFVLSTKVGYGIPGYEDWTYDCVIAGIEAACRRLRTDVIDIVHLHSCSREILANNGVAEALAKSVEAGKARVAAYAGDNDDARYAVESGRFGVLQTSVNVCDQAALDDQIQTGRKRGMGILAKRAFATAPWCHSNEPDDPAAATYWRRFQVISQSVPRVDQLDADWGEIALRFAAFADGVDSVLIGTRDARHLNAAVLAVTQGPLAIDLVEEIERAFELNGRDWSGVV